MHIKTQYAKSREKKRLMYETRVSYGKNRNFDSYSCEVDIRAAEEREEKERREKEKEAKRSSPPAASGSSAPASSTSGSSGSDDPNPFSKFKPNGTTGVDIEIAASVKPNQWLIGRKRKRTRNPLMKSKHNKEKNHFSNFGRPKEARKKKASIPEGQRRKSRAS